jgi:FixJ family two-component response regulator
LRRLLQSAGYRVWLCGSAEEFLALCSTIAMSRPICVVVDVRMPGLTGIDLQAVMSGTAFDPPLIMISGHADGATVARAIAAGAVSFLCKPFEDDALVDAVEVAIAEDRRRLSSQPAWIRKNRV